MRRVLPCSLFLALAVIAAVGVVPAQAELQLGIQDDALLTSQEPNAWPFARGLAPKVVRYNVGWEQVAPTRPAFPDDPADPAYDFKHADAMAKQTAAIGAQSLFTLVNSPRWANGARRRATRRSNADLYGQFCGVVAWRYSGTYTPPGALVPLPAVKNFTVWNEPNRGQYLLPQGPGGLTAARTFARLVRACADAVHAVSPDARVAVGPIASRGAQGGASPIAFLDAYRLAGGPRPQALALNPYMNGLVPDLQAQRDAGRRRDHAAQPRPARALAEQGLRRAASRSGSRSSRGARRRRRSSAPSRPPSRPTSCARRSRSCARTTPTRSCSSGTSCATSRPRATGARAWRRSTGSRSPPTGSTRCSPAP